MAQLRFIFLYVGQGDGTFIILPDNTTILVDLGSLKNSETAGKNAVKTIADELTALGKTSIDYLFITHSDRDHNNLLWELDLKITGTGLYSYPFTNVYIGGEKSNYHDFYVGLLLNNKETAGKLTLFGDSDHDTSTTPRWPAASMGGVDMYLLSANVPTRKNALPNPKSIVLMLSYQGWKVILSGDAEETAEDYMLHTAYATTLAFLKSFALKLGHHGAETATTDGWLQAVLPDCSVISSDQKWGHPYCTVLKRLEDQTTIWTNSNMKHGYVCGAFNRKRSRSGDDARYNWTNIDDTRLIFTTLVKADDAQLSSVGGHYELLIRDSDQKINFKMWTGLAGVAQESGWFNANGT
ncbi:MAG: beta-lactamase [Bacteroidetes bacterium]|nr:MAG: beta-lactamase [Bacteroidota bacterium]